VNVENYLYYVIVIVYKNSSEKFGKPKLKEDHTRNSLIYGKPKRHCL
jgi:hypothetical protein